MNNLMLSHDAGINIGVIKRMSFNNVYKFAIDTTREATDNAQAKSATKVEPMSELFPEFTDCTTECS